MFEAGWPDRRSMTKFVPEGIWRQILKSNSSAASDWKPAATILGGADLAALRSQESHPGSDGKIELAQLKCEGLPGGGGCSSGGSYGTSAMYGVMGRKLCESCATKALGGEGLPAVKRIELLTPYLLK